MGLCGCTSGALKWNQSGTPPAAVTESGKTLTPRQSAFTVLIVPSGATKTAYISDKTSTIGGFLGSAVVGPVAGIVGSLAASTAGSNAAASAEEAASQKIDASDLQKAVAGAQLSTYFAESLSAKLNQCGLRSSVYDTTLDPQKMDWTTTHLSLPGGFDTTLTPYRFFVQAGVTGLQVRSGIKDDTLQGDAYTRVYETQSLRQIGRYAYKTGGSGSVTLNHYSNKDSSKDNELQQAAKQVADYLAGGVAADMCTVMKRF